MKTEKEKMLKGALYNALDPELSDERQKARLLLSELNDLTVPPEQRIPIVSQLIPHAGKNVCIQPPFYCDYGYNIFVGDDVFFNFNCVVLDVMTVTIGSRTLIGPGVQIYAATHPLNFKERAAGLEYAKPVIIGKDVWIGGGAIICPGVTIGDRAVVGAGSVVTRDVPPDVVVAGNPCKVIRRLEL